MSDEKALAPINRDRPQAALWEIRNNIAQLLYAPPEQLDESLDELDKQLEALHLQFDDKIDNCVRAIKNRKAESGMIGNEIKKLRAMKTASDNNIQWLINYVDEIMTSLNLTEAGTGLFKVRVVRSPMTVKEINIHDVPDEFVEVVLKLDKRKVIEHIKSTGEIPAGVEMIQGHHLRIT